MLLEWLKSFFNKIKNWITTGNFISLYLITYYCNNQLGSIIVRANSKPEAVKNALNELKHRYGCTSVTIVSVELY